MCEFRFLYYFMFQTPNSSEVIYGIRHFFDERARDDAGCDIDKFSTKSANCGAISNSFPNAVVMEMVHGSEVTGGGFGMSSLQLLERS